MGWKFWERQKSEAELSLEQLQGGGASVAAADPSMLTASGATAAMPTSYGGGFEMTVEDVFSITGRGTVLTGRVSAGSVSTGMRVTIRAKDGQTLTDTVSGIEMFRKVVTTANPGDNIGLLLTSLGRDQVEPGSTVTA